MRRIPLSCLILGALFVNAALGVQGSESNSGDTIDARVLPSPTKSESHVVVDSTHSSGATTGLPGTPKKETASRKSIADEAVKSGSVPTGTEHTPALPHPPPNSPPPTTPKPTPTPTPSPITSPTPTPTPTPPPSPTSPSTPTPSPIPTPSPSPPEYSWIVRGQNGTVCILASMRVKLEFNINSTQQVIPVPDNASGTGHCGNDSQVLQLSWPNSTMTFSFALENSTNLYHLSNIDVVSKLSSLNKTAKFSAKVKTFSTNVKSSYECTWSEPVTGPLSNSSEAQGQLKITITDVHVEAFHNSTSDKFSLALVCQTDASDIVPVMVGVALAFLVLVVLIVYVIGRRNSQARGYLSM